MLVIASQKFVSREVLPYENIHNSRDIFYDEMLFIFVMNTMQSSPSNWHAEYGKYHVFSTFETNFPIGTEPSPPP